MALVVKSPFIGEYEGTTFIKDQDTKAIQYRIEVLDGEIYELTIARINIDTNKRHEFVLMLTPNQARSLIQLMQHTIKKGLQTRPPKLGFIPKKK
jgi:hypothetical protein